MRSGVEGLYRQQLNDTDLRVVRGAVGADVPLATALGLPSVEAAVFGPQAHAGPGVSLAGSPMVSPFLAFAVAVNRTCADLRTATFVEERFTPRMRIPVFDVAELLELVAEPLRRYFLVELLASYTRVTSGVTWTRTARGWRRRRFSELDPLRLAGMVDVVGAAERPGVYRRLGDLALFLLGVFPDHPPIEGVAADRLLRISRVGAEGVSGLSQLSPMELFELLGARWYRAAVATAGGLGVPLTGTMVAAGYVADHFRGARRVLNAVTDRYLFPWREQWFGGR